MEESPVPMEIAPTRILPEDIIPIIQHNFSGQKEEKVLRVFLDALRDFKLPGSDELKATKKVRELVKENLQGNAKSTRNHTRDNRFPLILGDTSAALQMLKGIEELAEAEVIFGSRFPQDLEYTQICININRIRLAMDKGRKVILLNLETLYESLYELLNQSYMVMKDGNRFVEIGLGTHRHRTRVHSDFRLIVVAEYDEVRRTFPAALVNRLEKHAYFIQTDMAQPQKDMARKLKDWAACATNPSAIQQNRTPGFGTTLCRFAEEDVFVGFSSEAVYSLISDRYEMANRDRHLMDYRDLTEKDDLEWLKEQLIHTCVPEGVLRMADSELGIRRKAEAEWAAKLYFNQPLHNSLKDMLPAWLPFPASDSPMMQITSYQSQILGEADKYSLQAAAAALDVKSLVIWQLRQFNTEAAFEAALREVFERDGEKQLLLIQCLAAQQHPKLIAACRYKLEEMRKRYPCARVHVGLILMLHRLPFHLPERVKRWLEAGRDPVLQLTSHRNLSDGDADKSALIQAAGLVEKESLHLVLESNNRQVQLNDKLKKAKLRAKDKELGLQLIVIQFHHLEERKPAKTASDVRGSLMKELEEAGESGKRVKVVLVTTLPRTGSFPGRGWKSWHLDNLSPEPGDLPNIGRLATQSPAQLLLSADSDNAFDARSFVKMCVAEAASRIQDEPASKASRCTLFIYLLDKNGEFCDEVIRRLAGLVKEKEEELGAEKMKNWVQLEAKNIRSVVDSRTFSKALRRRLETVVAPLLAGLLCFLDSYSNLAVLVEKAVWRGLWLELLKSDAIVASLRLHSGLFQLQGEHSGMKTEFVVLGNGRFKANFPFSWLLSERLESLIVAEETRLTVADEMVSDVELLLMVAESLKRVPWGEAVLEATQDNRLMATVMKDYITDLAHLRIRLPESVGYEMLMERVGSLASEWRQSRGEPNSLLASQLAFQRLQPELSRYQRLAHGFPDIAGKVEPSANPIDLVLAEAILHFLARHFALTKQLKDDVEPYLQAVIPFEAISEGWKGEYDKWNTRFRHAVAHGIQEIILEYEDRQPELRQTWTALEVARLFISHVSHLSYHFHANSIYRVVSVERTLTLKSVKEIQERLSLHGQIAFKKHFPSWKKNAVCVECGGAVRRGAIGDGLALLPCLHPVHDAPGRHCLQDLLDRGAKKCPQCNKELGEDPRQSGLAAIEKQMSEYRPCRDALRGFFLQLLGDVVFAAGEAPDRETVEYLLGLCYPEEETTLRLSPLADEPVDSGPVVRAFLLQHLLRFQTADVVEQIDLFYSESIRRLKANDATSFKAMCVHVVEDSEHSRLGQQASREEMMDTAHRLLSFVTEAEGDVSDMLSIGKTKVAAFLLAELLVTEGEDEMEHELVPLVRSLSKEAQTYLVRCLVRRFGMDKAKATFRRPAGAILADALDLTEDPDARDTGMEAFLVYGQEYKEARTQLLETLEKGKAVETGGSLMGTLALLRVADSRPDTPLESLGFTRPPCDGLGPLLANLVRHAFAVFSRAEHQPLLRLFHRMVQNPAGLQGQFLLTMPEDAAFAIMQMVRALPDGGTSTLNACPNGHEYEIANCGRPNEAAICGEPGCGMRIGAGGGRYQYAHGNRLLERDDRTLAGYCLPQAPVDGLVRERLGPEDATLLRLLQHIALLAGISAHPADIMNLVTKNPAPNPIALHQRFGAYAATELRALSHSLGRSEEDVAILLHLFLRQAAQGDAQNAQGIATEPRSRQQRGALEQALSQRFLHPLLVGAAAEIRRVREAMAGDEVGQERGLLHLAYHGDPTLWDYQLPLTFNNLKRDLTAQASALPKNRRPKLLQYFMKNQPALSALRFLPSIYRLQKFLISHFHGSVHLPSVQELSIKAFLGQPDFDDHQKQELRSWMGDFFEAWNICQEHGGNFAFLIPTSQKNADRQKAGLPQVMFGADWESEPLETVLPLPLPSRAGFVGFCLPQALILIQNELVDAHRSLLSDPTEVRSLAEAVAAGTLVRVEGESAVLPLLLLHRHLAVGEVEEGTQSDGTRTFRLETLEAAIRSKFLYNVQRLSTKRTTLLRTSEEMLATNLAVLAEGQTELRIPERNEILRAVGADLATASQCVNALELLLRYASSNESPDEQLGSLLKRFGNENCPPPLVGFAFRSLADLWTTLLLHQALERRRQDVEAHPETVEPLVDQAWTDEERVEMRKALEKLGQREMRPIGRFLTRFLILYAPRLRELSKPQLDQQLEKPLVLGIGDLCGAEEGEAAEVVHNLPTSILLRHVVPLWELIAQRLIDRPVDATLPAN